MGDEMKLPTEPIPVGAVEAHRRLLCLQQNAVRAKASESFPRREAAERMGINPAAIYRMINQNQKYEH